MRLSIGIISAFLLGLGLSTLLSAAVKSDEKITLPAVEAPPAVVETVKLFDGKSSTPINLPGRDEYGRRAGRRSRTE